MHKTFHTFYEVDKSKNNRNMNDEKKPSSIFTRDKTCVFSFFFSTLLTVALLSIRFGYAQHEHVQKNNSFRDNDNIIYFFFLLSLLFSSLKTRNKQKNDPMKCMPLLYGPKVQQNHFSRKSFVCAVNCKFKYINREKKKKNACLIP